MRKLKTSFIALSLGLMGYFPVNAQDISIENPWPETPEENLCRCKKDGCYGGNLISFRARCGEGFCAASSSNCPL